MALPGRATGLVQAGIILIGYLPGHKAKGPVLWLTYIYPRVSEGRITVKMAKETTNVMNASEDRHWAGGRDPALLYIAGVLAEVVNLPGTSAEIQFIEYEVIAGYKRWWWVSHVSNPVPM